MRASLVASTLIKELEANSLLILISCLLVQGMAGYYYGLSVKLTRESLVTKCSSKPVFSLLCQ